LHKRKFPTVQAGKSRGMSALGSLEDVPERGSEGDYPERRGQRLVGMSPPDAQQKVIFFPGGGGVAQGPGRRRKTRGEKKQEKIRDASKGAWNQRVLHLPRQGVGGETRGAEKQSLKKGPKGESVVGR